MWWSADHLSPSSINHMNNNRTIELLEYGKVWYWNDSKGVCCFETRNREEFGINFEYGLIHNLIPDNDCWRRHGFWIDYRE